MEIVVINSNVKIAVILMYTGDVPLMVKNAIAVGKWDTSASAVKKETFYP